MPLSGPARVLVMVEVIGRHALGEAVPFNSVRRLGELEIDILHRQVRAGSSEPHLTGLEQTRLYLLAARAGQVVTHDEIPDALWGVDYVSESNVVDRHVRSLREAAERRARATVHRDHAAERVSVHRHVLGASARSRGDPCDGRLKAASRSPVVWITR